MDVQALGLNATEGPKPTYCRDLLRKTSGPKTLQTACEFVRRVAEVKAEKILSDKKAVRQVLVNTTIEEMHKQGILELECSVSESSVTEPQGKRLSGAKEVPRTKNSSN